MNLQQLYKDIYETDHAPTEAELKTLVGLMPALPDDIFNTVFEHYVKKKPVSTIAAEMNSPKHVVEHWRKAGVGLLKIMVIHE